MNTGRACDFLPWLLELPWQHKKDVRNWTEVVREYVIQHLLNSKTTDKSLVDTLMKKVQADENNKVSLYFMKITELEFPSSVSLHELSLFTVKSIDTLCICNIIQTSKSSKTFNGKRLRLSLFNVAHLFKAIYYIAHNC